ncbi:MULTISPECIES: aromatic ring-hydroxylating oxygenase subunit alpha [Sulfolobaceae]|uniref:Aromatic ring-hydroxylating dioxygenase subunit alpha n=1 Tax=Metallosphaera prunae TaxID=47304 RepID=A0A4D8RQB8_METPR|nr:MULTISPECIES: Rieske 2Fe-2S domain-containing protein [Sulfolobaceae]MCY0851098.1 Rieske 2Fe-2S domain-containing protein [Sulfuracidifex metallicus]QCO29123.1 aromatic ring-hydroxylating dioxygenase subunit alpha [Metallosphaera prunae]BBL47294.1 3-phenylpropionate/cinnamic acid dioxygenase subunit alpha [Metallosphaera sedula]
MLSEIEKKLLEKISEVPDLIKEKGLFPLSLIADPDVFNLELKFLFPRVWNFLAHESEIPSKGDYVKRYIGPYTSIIMVRGEDDKVRAFLDLCRHKGRGICRAEKGNAVFFRCPYHFWTYSNMGELISVSLEEEGYGKSLDKSRYGLVEIKTEIYNGFIFGSIEPEESLRDYLGEFSWYTDIITKRDLEVYTPQRWIGNFNWKLGAENFAHDSYHTAYTHKSAVDLGLPLMGPKGKVVSQRGIQFVSSKGHSGGMRGAVTREEEKASNFRFPFIYERWDPKTVTHIKEVLTAEQFEVFSMAASSMRWNIFPNFSFLIHPMGSFDPKTINQDFPYGFPTPWLHFKIWRPISESKTEILNFFAVERVASEEAKERSYWAYLHAFGPSGMFEMDDIENWITITQNSLAVSKSGKEVDLPYLLGAHRGLIKDFVWKHGDEIEIQYEVTEHGARSFWINWAKNIVKGAEKIG